MLNTLIKSLSTLHLLSSSNWQGVTFHMQCAFSIQKNKYLRGIQNDAFNKTNKSMIKIRC
jgi:hypothetical protein